LYEISHCCGEGIKLEDMHIIFCEARKIYEGKTVENIDEFGNIL